jgi:cation transport ATPase
VSKVVPVDACRFRSAAGRGARARVSGKSVIIGGPRLLTEGKAIVPLEVERSTTTWASEGNTILYIIAGDELLGAFAVEDEI